MRFGFAMPSVVWFCTSPACDDTPPWKSDQVEKCPSCNSTDDVTRAVRFQNLETEADGTRRSI